MTLPRFANQDPRWRRRMQVAGMLLYLILPSLAWSSVYRQFKLVADPLLLIPVELFLPRVARPLFRFVWIAACGMMLLLEWNIFFESYRFYAQLLASIALTGHGATILAAILLFALFLALPLPRVRHRGRFLAVGATLYLAVVGAKMLPWGKEHLAWIRVPMLRAAQVAISDGPRAFGSVVGDAGGLITHRLYDETARTPPSALPPKMLVVLLESWGERPDDLARLGTAVAVLPGVGRIETGYNRFHGSTLPAEVRELCGRKLDFAHPEALGGYCLPRRLAEAGYGTAAFHGYDGFFYSRDIIYPALGFQRSFFRPDLKNLPQCGGAFEGACDDAVLDRAIATINRPGRQFVYMMSLTAHAPVAAASLARPYVSAARLKIEGDQSQALNRALAMEAVRRMAGSPGALVYIAGDHNPPGAEQELGLPAGRTPYLLVRIASH